MTLGLIRLMMALTILCPVLCMLPSLVGKFRGKFSVDVIKSGALSVSFNVSVQIITLLFH